MTSIYIQRPIPQSNYGRSPEAHHRHRIFGMCNDDEEARSPSRSVSSGDSSPSAFMDIENVKSNLDGSIPRYSLSSTPAESTHKLLRRLSPNSSEQKASPCTISPLKFISSSSSIPLSSKQTNGEDAHFVSESAVGVADGVGGWAALGVDAGLYSRKLMQKASEIIRKNGEWDPTVTLRKAFMAMGRTVGTTTACIVSLQGNTIRAANLGDSGFIVLRFCYDSSDASELMNPGWKVMVRSRKQQHNFNCPFQIGTDSAEHPCHADPYEFTCEWGDLLLVATDGIFDNLFEHQIADIVARRFPNDAAVRRERNISAALDALAMDLANEALQASMNREIETPFSLEARENHYEYTGGKEDDITVVVSLVHDHELTMEEANGTLSGAFQYKLNLLAAESPRELLAHRKRERSSILSTSQTSGSSGSPRQRADSW